MDKKKQQKTGKQKEETLRFKQIKMKIYLKIG